MSIVQLTSPRWVSACVLLFVAACVTACQGTSTSPGSVQATNLPAAACNGKASPGDFRVGITSAGVQRTVLLHLPPGYADTKPVALVLNLHGSGSTAAAQAAFSGMNAVSDADGFIVAYPQGAITSGTGYDWNVPGQPLFGGAAVPAGAADDVTFLSTVISTLEGDLCIDSKRVYATGFSGGSRMTSQLACDLSGVIAAIAPVSGLRLPAPCTATRPVPVITFHGTADPIDPYSGNGQAYWTYGVPVAAQRWAARDGCGATPADTEPETGVELTAYGGCEGGAVVDLYTIVGEGHEWPGGPTLPAQDTNVLGAQSNAINADTTMWAFFAAHPLP